MKLRVSEWLLIGFFAYVALIVPFFPNRPRLGYQPALTLASVIALFIAVAWIQQIGWTRVLRIARDWIPVCLTLVAFREMELFLPQRYSLSYELAWIRWDGFLFDKWHLSSIIESFGPVFPFLLEFSYLLVYSIPVYCLSVIYYQRRRHLIDMFLTVYLVGTLIAYALFPYFPSQPPRLAFPDLYNPTVITVIRRFNLWILNKATIHTGVFPSAHVSSAFSAAWGLFLLLPNRKIFGWTMLAYAVTVSVATIYGRYHYSADVFGGFLVSLAAAAVALLLRRMPRVSEIRRAPRHPNS